jgi:ATP-binding cassette subfamily B protein
MAQPPIQSEAERASSRRVGVLVALWPFIRPYWRIALAALVALVFTAAISLILPIAARRVVDSFGVAREALLDSYFGAALGIAAALAVGTAVITLSPALASGWWRTSARRCSTG